MTRSEKKKPPKRAKKNPPGSTLRRRARRTSIAAALAYALFCCAGAWYAGHAPEWLEEARRSLPRCIWRPLEHVGDRVRNVTDALDWTGHDAVYGYDAPAPTGSVFFAGAPRRTGEPAPADLTILPRGAFTVGYSPALGHGVWAAYHVPVEAKFSSEDRPNFRMDRQAARCPASSAYANTGYDRGHLAPNHAVASRFGRAAQEKTFLLSNVAPQTPALNRGPWREMEQRITELWAARYGEIWVQTGTVATPAGAPRQQLPGSQVDVPTHWWMLVVAQEGEDVRALAVLMPQTTSFDFFPVHAIVTIDELERVTGLDLLPDLPDWLQRPLEADRPTRLWPVRLRDCFKLLALRFDP